MGMRGLCRFLLCAVWPVTALAQSLNLIDDIGRTVRLPAPARRIVSLAPHITELVYAAGAGERLVGAVDYSNYPPQAAALPRVGSYAAVDLEAVLALKPDLVIAWKTGNADPQYERIIRLGIPVFVSEPRRLDDVAISLSHMGRLAGTSTAAEAAAAAFRTRRDALAARYAGRAPVKVFYEIWHQPLMTVNGQHLISDVMALCGGRNVFASVSTLAPAVSEEAVLAAAPQAIVASGMDAARPEWLDAWRRWRSLPAVARDNLFFIPPELLQRHTPRILDGAQRLCEQLDQARRRPP